MEEYGARALPYVHTYTSLSHVPLWQAKEVRYIWLSQKRSSRLLVLEEPRGDRNFHYPKTSSVSVVFTAAGIADGGRSSTRDAPLPCDRNRACSPRGSGAPPRDRILRAPFCAPFTSRTRYSTTPSHPSCPSSVVICDSLWELASLYAQTEAGCAAWVAGTHASCDNSGLVGFAPLMRIMAPMTGAAEAGRV